MTPGPATMSALERCVGDGESFLAGEWGRAPLLRRCRGSAGFADLLSMADVDHLIATTSIRTPAFRMVKDGKPINAAEYTRSINIASSTLNDAADVGRVFEHFHGGATIVLQALQRYWLPLTRFCRELELTFTHPFQANAYITPPEARGLGVHFDTHDVFVLQVAGRKRWSVWDPTVDAPMQWHKTVVEAEGDPLISVDLEAGDSLYIPRGFLHAAVALDEVSAHLTVGALTTTWQEVLTRVVREASEDVTFRRALPVGYANDADAFAAATGEMLEAFRGWLEKLDPAKVSVPIQDRFWANRPPSLDGQLAQLAALNSLTDDTPLRRRVGSVCHMKHDTEAGRVTIGLGDRQVQFPAELAEVLGWIAAQPGEFTVDDLMATCDLDRPSRYVLARRLIREGLLAAGPGPSPK